LRAALYVYDLKTTKMAEMQNLEIIPDTSERKGSVMMEMMRGNVSQQFLNIHLKFLQMAALEGDLAS
jgi:hypothetical protein